MKWNLYVVDEVIDVELLLRTHRGNPFVFLLDSSNKDEDYLTLPENSFLKSKSRFAYVGLNPVKELSWHKGHLRIGAPGNWSVDEKCIPDAALDRLEGFVESETLQSELPAECGPQYFMFASYEFGEDLVEIANDKPSLLEIPGLQAWLCGDQLVVDWQTNRTYYFHRSENELSHSEMRWRFDRLFNAPIAALPVSGSPPDLKPNFKQEDYLDAISAIKRHIRDGHVYLLNISQAFRFNLKMSIEEVYIRMRKRNPAPFGAFFKTPQFAILSTSPERFLRRDNDRLSTEPIKGTRPRGKTPEEDERKKAELLASVKEQAEHTMVVDLLRNDIGKVCEYGSVMVEDSFYVERYRMVHQLISRVVGRLRRDLRIGSIFRETFPGGSITGAPKKRVMEIIAEIEPQRRAAYTGTLGRHAVKGGNFDLSIIIRSVTVVGDDAFLSVGGGIVFDSDEQQEYQESLDKGIPIINALCDPESEGASEVEDAAAWEIYAYARKAR